MKPHDIADLLLLSAIWGASFLFMRVAAPEFGTFALMLIRSGLAALIMIAIVAMRGLTRDLRAAIVPATLIGVLNSALPFALWGYALQHLPAGYSAILNATTPMFAALVALLWMGDRLPAVRIVGLAVGFAGVVLLSWARVTGRIDQSLPVLACLAATLCYGVAASAAKRFLTGVSPVASATGSQIGAALALLPFAMFAWPAQSPSTLAWGSAIVLSVACTAWAYFLYFKLIANTGAQRAATVTFLIPVFAVLWGAMFLGEKLGLDTVIGGVVVLLGSALATGVLAPGKLAAR
jgi:drug/metabolite transporter (DMT)-like permease